MTNIEILRGELERLFSLEELTQMSERLLGLDPKEVGGSSAKGSFAKALTERCVDGDRIEAENLYQHAEHYFRIMRE